MDLFSKPKSNSSSNSDSIVFCEECGQTFKPIQLKHNIFWSPKEQMKYHKKEDGCILLFNDSVHYVYFHAQSDEDLIRPIDGLPVEIGNIFFVYTGQTEEDGLIRALTQIFKLYSCYENNKTNVKGDRLAANYARTAMKRGLFLSVIRCSADYKEIKNSEFSSKFQFK